MSTSRYRQARDLSALKIARLRKQTPSIDSTVKAPFKQSATTLRAGIWRSFGEGPGGNEPPRAGYRMGKDVAQRRITLARVSLLEKD